RGGGEEIRRGVLSDCFIGVFRDRLVKLVVGLGNPGRKYERTRHNLGFLVIDRIATENEIAIKKKLCDAFVGEWSSNGEKIFLVKPQTFMNRSGDAVKGLLRKFHASPEQLVVICDDRS